MNASSSKTKGLGKGISALIAEEEVPVTSSMQTESKRGEGREISDIALSDIIPGTYQPRTGFNEEALEELANSIRKNGVMQPVLLRRLGTKARKYEIVAGERRWRAAKMAGLTSVPAIIKELSDQQTLEYAIIENVQRQDLSPLEEAEGYQRLSNEFGYTQEDLSNAVGRSRSHIANLLRLLSLPETVKRMVEEGSISAGHARTLVGIENAEGIAKEVVKRNLNVRQTELLVKNGPGSSRSYTAKKPATPKNSDISALEQTLSQNVGLKVRIKDRGNMGDIIISYQNLKQLDEILQKLGGVI